MSACNFKRIRAILSILCYIVFSAFASPLENQAVLKDSKLQFVCHHNSTSKAQWSYWSIGKKPKDAVIIPSNTTRTSRRIVTKSDDQKQTILTIEPVHLDDAGTYECKIHDTVIGKSVTLLESKFTANLVVLVSVPVCKSGTSANNDSTTSTEENIHISLQCTIEYRGNLDPLMEWRRKNASDVITDGVTNIHAKNQIMTSTLETWGTSLFSVYTCTIRFKPLQTKDVSSASNSPDYRFIWTGSGSTKHTGFVGDRVGGSQRIEIGEQTIHAASSAADERDQGNQQGVSYVTIITTSVLSMSFFVAGVTIAAMCFHFKAKTSKNRVSQIAVVPTTEVEVVSTISYDLAGDINGDEPRDINGDEPRGSMMADTNADVQDHHTRRYSSLSESSLLPREERPRIITVDTAGRNPLRDYTRLRIDEVPETSSSTTSLGCPYEEIV